MRGDIRQGSGIIEAAAVLSLTIGSGNAFASRQGVRQENHDVEPACHCDPIDDRQGERVDREVHDRGDDRVELEYI